MGLCFTGKQIMANFLEIYKKVTNLPFGNYLFDKGVGFVAPFFGKIRPNVIGLRDAPNIISFYFSDI